MNHHYDYDGAYAHAHPEALGDAIADGAFERDIDEWDLEPGCEDPDDSAPIDPSWTLVLSLARDARRAVRAQQRYFRGR